MKLIHRPNDLINGDRKACLAIGMFDGVHLGHQQVLRQAIEDSHRHEARSVAVTFDRHPATVIAPGRAPALLQTRAQRLLALDRAIEADYTRLLELIVEPTMLKSQPKNHQHLMNMQEHIKKNMKESLTNLKLIEIKKISTSVQMLIMEKRKGGLLKSGTCLQIN